jgi:putative FmdB family regulatory protein
MPTYVYRCTKCKHRFELFHSITDETIKRCPRCKSKAERVPAGGAGILFKGSGFYITDYRSSSYKERAKQDKPGATGGGDGGSTGTSGSGGASPGASGTSSASGGSASKSSSSSASGSPSGSPSRSKGRKGASGRPSGRASSGGD